MEVVALEAYASDTENIAFVYGTLGNKIVILDYEEDGDVSKVRSEYDSKEKVWDLAVHGMEMDKLLTASGDCVLWSMKDTRMEQVGRLKNGGFKKVLFDPHEEGNFVTWTDDCIVFGDLVVSDSMLQCTDRIEKRISNMNYDPHEERKFGMAVGESIEYRDLKCDDGIVIPYAHDGGVLDIDFNPNKPNYIVSGGKDGIVLFWDLRKTDKPLRSESKHSHWVYRVQYNRFHDQLVLSSSSDSTVQLYRMSSISSSARADVLHPSTSSTEPEDVHIQTLDMHQDSVYSIAWSCTDSFIFATASYDGKVSIHNVPSNEKYKILL